jgi:hypothetical protein
MRPLPLKPHAIEAYPDAFNLLNSIYGLKKWFKYKTPPNDDYAHWNNKKCRYIEYRMKYNHTDNTFNDTMLWLKQISLYEIDGWISWVKNWDLAVNNWPFLRPRMGDFSYIKENELREEYVVLYHILCKEPIYWSLFISEEFSGETDIFTDFAIILYMGWEKWIDKQIGKKILNSNKRDKKNIIMGWLLCIP